MSNTTLLLLTPDIKNIDDVKNKILTIQKKDDIRNITEDKLSKISSSEKFFISKWQTYEGYTDICNLNLPNGQDINFYVKEAYIETSRQSRNMYNENGELLPKIERTLIDNTKTIFFERNNRVYIILFSTNSVSINKIKKLLEEDIYLQTANSEINIDNDLFYWLFYKYKEKNKLLSERFEVEAISGFIGNIADEHHIIKGESEITPNLLVTKAFVSKFHPIRSLSVMLKLDDYSLNFVFNDICQCSIGLSSIVPNNKYEIDIAAGVVIYAYIIPKLQKLFEEDKKIEWTQAKKKEFTKSIGIEVIREIADFHGIDLKNL